jgi:hypothetical protein
MAKNLANERIKGECYLTTLAAFWNSHNKMTNEIIEEQTEEKWVGTRSGQSGEIRMTSGSDQQTLYA